MKPSGRTLQKAGRDTIFALVALIAWAVDGNTDHVTGSFNIPPESMGALLVVLLFAHRFIRDDLRNWWKRRKAWAPPTP